MTVRQPSSNMPAAAYRVPKRKPKGRAQKPRGRRPNLLPVLGPIAILAVLLVSGYGLWTWMNQSDLFRLHKVQIKGCNHLSEEEAVRMAGLTAQANVLRLDLASIARAIEAHPWVGTVEVQRKLPDRLTIAVHEHSPVARVHLDEVNLVAESGILFKETQAEEARALPLITGIPAEAVEGGMLPAFAHKALDLIAIASKGARTLGAGNIREVHVEDDGGLVVYTADQGIPIHFRTDDLRTEFRRAEKILFQLYRSGMYDRIAKVDLDYGPGRGWAELKH